jgi:hypothetical protein
MEPTLAEMADDILRRWLPALFEGLDQCTTEEQRIRILEHCGRACGQPDLEEVRRIRQEARDREHLLQLINERIPSATGNGRTARSTACAPHAAALWCKRDTWRFAPPSAFAPEGG